MYTFGLSDVKVLNKESQMLSFKTCLCKYKCQSKLLSILQNIVLLSPPVHMHGGLICITFCLDVCHLTKIIGPKDIKPTFTITILLSKPNQ